MKKPSPVFFSYLTSLLVLPVCGFMVLALYLASANDSYIVQFEFNRFSEGALELIFVCAVFVMAIINAGWSTRPYKANRKSQQ